jgi:Amt family ammonium transporter
MQAGFAMLEAGIVHPKNATNILFKNMIDASLAALGFWLLGYGFAYGTTEGGFIGKDTFAIGESEQINNTDHGWQGWFFQWAFAGAAATIVAGSVCERTKIEAYFIYSIVLTIFIYPVVVHWGWGSGFLSAWGAVDGPLFDKKDDNGMIDFAGSGVVHMVGGVSGLMGAIVVGPRKGRFVNGEVVELYEGNKILQSLGTFILWFGWYGFNCGSTLALTGGMANLAGKVAVTTTIAAASGAITATFLSKIVSGHYDISMGLNGILAALVSITANCSVVSPWHSILIGTIGAMIFFGGHYLLLACKIDDPCDACIVHGLCGCKSPPNL